MFALMMARRGHLVHMYEKRGDFRAQERADAARLAHLGLSADATKRSINLALSHRGQHALAAVGLLERIMAGVVPMPQRAMHSVSGGITTQPYGRADQAIFSASRSLLNRTLLEACDALPNVVTTFNCGVRSVTSDGVVTLDRGQAGDTITVRARLVVGADGAYSAVRSAMLRLSRMDFSRSYIAHGYKELNMPPVDGTFALPVPHALHIWPRHQFMMIALPNPDFTFTCTLFLPWETLEALEAEPDGVRPFFIKHFPDALPLIPQLEAQFASNPSGALVTCVSNPWNTGDKILLIGDAAHATVPFYGQGANAAFEDCDVFAATLDAAHGDLSAAVRTFAAERKPAGDALQALSMDNYVEMRHKTASPLFLFQKQVEAVLHWAFPQWWIPLYSMVAFTSIPYHVVIQRAQAQERILNAAAAATALAAGATLAYAGWRWGHQVRHALRRLV